MTAGAAIDEESGKDGPHRRTGDGASAGWKVWRTTRAPILIGFSRRPVSDRSAMASGKLDAAREGGQVAGWRMQLQSHLVVAEPLA